MRINKTFLVVTVDTRITEFQRLLQSIYSRDLNDWNIVCVLQNYNQDQQDDLVDFVKMYDRSKMKDRTKMIFVQDLVGPHSARIIGLNNWESDIWCNLDDDMEIIDQANFDPIINHLLFNESTGFISGNWIRSESFLPKKKIKDEFTKQSIVYTGGGLFYRSDIANLMKNHPDKNYLFDDIEWTMTAYIHGYENFRYLGSVIIHRVCTKGGRRVWVAQKNRDLPDDRLITVEAAAEFYKDVDNNYKIPASKNLTDKAKRLHKTNKELFS